MVAPRPGAGAWTVPPSRHKTLPVPSEATIQPHIPEAPRGLVERMGQLGSVGGVDGLLGPQVLPGPDTGRGAV